MAQTQERSGQGEADERRPLASLDAFLSRAEQQAPDWVMMMMRLPPRGNGPVTVLIQEPTAPHIYARSQLALDRSTAKIINWEPYAGASLGRKAQNVGARTSHRRGARFPRPNRCGSGVAGRLFSGMDGLRHGMAALPATETVKQIASP